MLVGAQAVDLHAGEADLLNAGAPYTKDADLAIRPSQLADSPLLGDLMKRHGFTPSEHRGDGLRGQAAEGSKDDTTNHAR